MNESQKCKYRDQLLAMASHLRRDAWTIEDQARDPVGGQAGGNLSNAPMHLADSGTDQNLQELNSVLFENERYLLNEVQAALKRLENGAFGRCSNCGTWISQVRLDAIPYAKTCVKCADVANEGPDLNLDLGRPLLETETIAAEEKLITRTEVDSAIEEFLDDDSQSSRSRGPSQSRRRRDTHAAGSAGGGTATGGLAGSNVGRGDPVEELEDATATGQFDIEDQTGPA